MVNEEGYCSILDVCTFLEKHRSQFTSYGIKKEIIMGDDRELLEVPALKPNIVFRGQTKVYDTLRPSIYRKYIPHSTWQKTRSIRIDNDSLVMPHAHYSADLEMDFYFSCIKAADIIHEVTQLFPEYPENKVEGHALCQHYGLPTHCLDFSECLWTAGFFASHSFQNGSFSPCLEGIGVMYVLKVDQVPPSSLYEIGIQPLPRPEAQRGWLLRVPPEVNLLFHPAVSEIHFKHSEDASQVIGERFKQGKDLLPVDKIAQYIESRLNEKTVSKDAIEIYLNHVPENHRPKLRTSIECLFHGKIEIV